MAWIRTIDEASAEGDLKRQYEAAVRRAGKVYHIVKLGSLNPEVNRTFMDLYVKIMHGPSDLSRREREMIATVVSWANHCHY